jgi:dTDP-4-dehydrorhamnose 3,5-epimerase-like enzyme
LGAIRGIHSSIANPGQAKIVTCLDGRVLDVIVDIRKNSPTFRKWVSIELFTGDGRAVFIEEGLGHAFQSMSEISSI